MRLILTFGLVAAVSAGAGAAAQHLTDFVAAPPLAAPGLAPADIMPVVARQRIAEPAPARRMRMPVESNPYGLVPGTSDARLDEIAGHESGLLAPAGTVTYRRVAGPRPHIASNPYYYSDVDDGQDHPVDPTREAMGIDTNPYAH